MDKLTNNIVALKRIRCDDEGVPATALREITLLKHLRSENVVELLNVVYQDNRVCMVLEYLDQDLKAYIDACPPGGMDPRLVKSFSYQLLNGLAVCHANRVMHRDLKPQNLLINTRGLLKLADFGLARSFNIPIRKFTHEVITLWYRAPEILLGEEFYSTPVDLWAAACIMAEMSNCAPLLPGDSEIDQLFRIFRLLGTPTNATWPGVERLSDYSRAFPQWPTRAPGRHCLPRLEPAGIALVQRLLMFAPSQRLTAREALDHEYFAVPLPY